MGRLLDDRFEWVLPGHGRIHHQNAEVMHRPLLQSVQRMKDTP